MKEKKIKGIILRYSQKYNLWVNKKDTHVYREYMNKEHNKFLQIHIRYDGSKYISLTFPGIVELDELVADCYKPMPCDGKKYMLIHKDNNLGNCSASNLEWYEQTSNKRITRRGIVATSYGIFYDGKKELLVVKDIGDADTDRMVGIDPLLYYDRRNKYGISERRSVHPDDLMAEVGFVKGDKSLLKKPKVLHKDMDYLNFNMDNLEWVEEVSQEYQNYKAKKKADIDELTKKLNPNKPLI